MYVCCSRGIQEIKCEFTFAWACIPFYPIFFSLVAFILSRLQNIWLPLFWNAFRVAAFVFIKAEMMMQCAISMTIRHQFISIDPTKPWPMHNFFPLSVPHPLHFRIIVLYDYAINWASIFLFYFISFGRWMPSALQNIATHDTSVFNHHKH